MFIIGKTITRTSPDGIVSEFTLNNQKEIDHHRDLMDNHGYTYAPKAVVNKSLAVCTSCEG
jgi:hypothetical protein